MRAIRQHGTDLELEIRRALYRAGLRYRVNVRREGTTIDIAFLGAKLAVFCDGCFWHGCPRHRTDAKHNGAWWRAKIDGNIARDRRLRRGLRKTGWRIVRVWAHESAEVAAERIVAALEGRAT